MKPFMCVDLTENTDNEKNNGEEFLICKPSESLTNSFDSSIEKIDDTIEKSALPLIPRIIMWICGALVVIAILFLEGASEDDDFFDIISNVYHKQLWVILLIAASLIGYVGLYIISHIKHKNTLKSDEYLCAVEYAKGVNEAIFNELSVPKNAKEIELLYFLYKIKKIILNSILRDLINLYCKILHIVFTPMKINCIWQI